MPIDIELPAGLTARPLTLEDAAAATGLIRAEEVVDLGQPEMTVEDIAGDWQRPSYDITTSTVGVLEGGVLVAYADVAGDGEAYTAVHPDHQGRGIGTALARWTQEVARARGYARIGSQVPQGSAADRLMTALGYQLRRTAWDLELPDGTSIESQPLPTGYTLRDAAEVEHPQVYAVVEDAFSEWRDRQPLEDFGSRVWGRPGHAPWNLRVVTDADGDLVGATHVYLTDGSGYIARLAVRRDKRGVGLARAMLVDAFALARVHGAGRCYLATDSRTGALTLYEKVGMSVTSVWVNRAKDL